MKLAALIMVIIGVSARLLPHPANVAPITALALFSGVYLSKKFFFIPLIAMLISDYFIGFYGITMLYVYGSFFIIWLIGLVLKNENTPGNTVRASLSSSILFYLITNFGVWVHPHSFYQQNFAGLMESYYMGLPFFRNTILGDLFYTVTFIRGYEIAKYLGKRYLPQKIYPVTF